MNSTDCLDCYNCHDCQFTYDCVDASKCFQAFHSQSCQGCSSCQYCYNCTGCHHCFGCINLQRKEYCLFNEVYQKSDYEDKVKKLLNDPFLEEKVSSFFSQHPRSALQMSGSEDCLGYGINTSKDCRFCCDLSECHDCKYCYQVFLSHDCCDVDLWGYHADLLYECQGVGNQCHTNILQTD